MTNDLKEIKTIVTQTRYHMIKLVATMIHLFEWIDYGDIIDKSNFRRFLDEYVLVQECVENKCKEKQVETFEKIALNGKLKKEEK